MIKIVIYFHFPIKTISGCRTWTGTLGLFLDRLVKHFNKRLFLEQSPKGGDIDEPQEPPPKQGETAVTQARRPLQDAQLERIAKVILQLASKAQYSKVGIP